MSPLVHRSSMLLIAAAALALATAGPAVADVDYTLGKSIGGIAADGPDWGVVGGRAPGELLITRYCDQPSYVGHRAVVAFDNDQGPNTAILAADWQYGERYGTWQNITLGPSISPDGQHTELVATIIGPVRNPPSDAGSCDSVYTRLASVTFRDSQGPAVGGLAVDGPRASGWFTGAVTVSWDASDNGALRGSTGAGIDAGGASADYGDPPDAARKVSAPLDPGPDGLHTASVYRTGQGWPTASATAAIQVDRTAPTVPRLALAGASTSAPVLVTASGSTDGAGSGLARYEYTIDGGATVRSGTGADTANVFRSVGLYNVQARAIDVVGHASAWSAPVAVLVTTGSSDAASAGDGSGTRNALPDFSAVRLTRFRALHAGRNRVISGKAVPVAIVSVGRRLALTGRFAHADFHGLKGATVVVRDQNGADLATTQTRRRGHFWVVFRPTYAGLYTLVALGQPEVGSPFVVRLRAAVGVHPRRARTLKDGQQVVALGRGRKLVVRGSVAPADWAAGRLVLLQYQAPQGPAWRPIADARTDASGRFVLRFQFRPGRYTGTLRVIAPAEPRSAYLTGISSPFVVSAR